MDAKPHTVNKMKNLKIFVGFLVSGLAMPLLAQTSNPAPAGDAIPSLVLTPIAASKTQPLPSYFGPDSTAASSPEDLEPDNAPSTIPGPSSSKTVAQPSGECYVPLGLFGVRLSTELAFFNLVDFNGYQTYLNFRFGELQEEAPGDQYRIQSSGPDNAVVLEITPFYPLNKDLEVGLNFDYWALTPFTFDATALASPNYFHDFQRNLSSLELNADFRFYFWKSEKGGTEFFLEGQAGIQADTAQMIQNYQDTGNTPSTDQLADNGSAVGLDASLKIGAAMDLGSGFLLSFKGGYQYSYATNFEGTYSDAQVAAHNGVKGSLMVFTDPNSGLNYIDFVPDNSADYASFGLTQAQVSAARKLVMDLSGLRLAMDLSFRF